MLYANPQASYKAHKKEINAAIRTVLNSERYILGTEVEKFEEEFAQYCDARYSVGVSSGTAALIVSLMACGIQPQDEVITVSHTAPATISAICAVGAIPIFVDIDDYYTFDVSKLTKAITSYTQAVIPVHLYGQPVDMPPLVEEARAYGLWVIEDCAQAHGTKLNGQHVGTFGDIGCFSMYPTKNLGAIGDAGAIITNNEFLASGVKSIRQYGWDNKRRCIELGINARLDELQAAILRVKLKYLEDEIQRRREIANWYSGELGNTPLVLPKERGNHSYHLYVARCQVRDDLMHHLLWNNIICGIHYSLPTHRHSAFVDLWNGQPNHKLPITEQICSEILSLPMYPQMTDEDVQLVINNVKDFF
jgi:dTDP-4-amino-4,6-dideoxygalactose transaminase